MPRGQSQPGIQSGMQALGRCKSSTENTSMIDVDVVIVDAPETSHPGSGGLRVVRRNVFPSGAIYINDEEGDPDDSPRNGHGYDTSETSSPASSNSPSAKESDSDECIMLTRKRKFPSKSTTKMRVNCKNISSRKYFSLDLSSESSVSKNDSSNSCGSASSESTSSDCELIEDSSGNIREQWERAALRKRTLLKDRFGSKDWASASGSFIDPISSSPETSHNKVVVKNSTNKIYSNYCDDVPVQTSPINSRNGKESVSSSVPTADILTEKAPLETNVDNGSSSGPTADKATEEHPLKTNANPCIADLDPISDAFHGEPSFQNKELTPEKCSLDETLFDHIRSPFRDVEVQLQEPSSCNSRLRHDEPDEACFHDKKDQISADPSCESKAQCDLNDDHEVFGSGEYKSVFEPSVCNSKFPSEPQPNAGSDYFCNSKEATLGEPICNNIAESGKTETHVSSDKESECLPPLHEVLIGERERHKESDEYKRAAEEEWASRMHQLQIQAEEAQRLRKRRKAERLLLDMERRQKQRLEEIRESQRQDEETINLKEKLRAEVRKELDQMELSYRDMPSLLRGLGIHVEGGPYPLSREVNSAYKRALLKFHPDRCSRTDIRQQVEAEERFKLVSRLKEKLLPLI